MLSSYVVLLTPPPEFSVDLAHVTFFTTVERKDTPSEKMWRRGNDQVNRKSVHTYMH